MGYRGAGPSYEGDDLPDPHTGIKQQQSNLDKGIDHTKSVQQADATRAPSGKVQQLSKDLDRKQSVLDQEGRSMGYNINPGNAAESSAFWGRNPIGQVPTISDKQRDENVKSVATSKNDTSKALDKAKQADLDKRNK